VYVWGGVGWAATTTGMPLSFEIHVLMEAFNNKIQDTRYFIFQSWSPVLGRIIIYKLKNINTNILFQLRSLKGQ